MSYTFTNKNEPFIPKYLVRNGLADDEDAAFEGAVSLARTIGYSVDIYDADDPDTRIARIEMGEGE